MTGTNDESKAHGMLSIYHITVQPPSEPFGRVLSDTRAAS